MLNYSSKVDETLEMKIYITHMLFSKNRMSSEFSSILSSTINSASLLPGNSESTADLLKEQNPEVLIHRSATTLKQVTSFNVVAEHVADSSNLARPHLSMTSTSTEEIPSFSVTVL